MGYNYAYEMERYDYAPEADDVEEYERDYFDESDGRVYVVQVEVRSYCIRKGNYSPVATDPEEYYGEYRTEFEITSAYYLTFSEDEFEIDVDDLPQWVYDEVAREFEE